MNRRYPRFYYTPSREIVNGNVQIDYEIENGRITNPFVYFGYDRVISSADIGKKKYVEAIPLVSRMSFADKHTCEELFASSVEELNSTEVPLLARHLRVLILELSRISAFFLNVFNISSALKFSMAKSWSLSDMKRVQRLIVEIKGSEFYSPFIIPGGVRCNVLSKTMGLVEREIGLLESKLNDYDSLLFQNELFRIRTSGVGEITKREITEFGVTGPSARAGNVSFDVRRRLPYEIYNEIKLDAAAYSFSNVYDRVLCRRNEIADSIRIIRYILSNIPHETEFINREGYSSGLLKVREGTVFRRIEGVNGEFVCLMSSDGSERPVNVKFRSPVYHIAGELLSKLISRNSIDDIDLVLASVFLIPMEVNL